MLGYAALAATAKPIDHIARDPRLLNWLEPLYGEEARLFKDKLIYKPPGAMGYALHQDHINWPSFSKSFLTVLIPIDPATDDMRASGIHVFKPPEA